MREIKFRAWIKKEDCIVDVDVLELDEKWIACPFEQGFNEDQETTEKDCVFKFNEIELMQFTGLKDKNGKEIYEGDIIDFGGLKSIEIVWRNSGFESKLLLHKDSNPIRLTEKGMSAFAEVIGNIYE